jgi:hypothetical protein
MKDFIDTIVALSGFVGVIVAIIAFINQNRDTHLTLGVQLLRDFERQFEGEGIRECRIELANHYLKTPAGDTLPQDVFLDNASPFDFFETIGVLLRRNVLDMEFVWTSFYYWVVHYWEIAEADINAFRKLQDDKTYYNECEYLYLRLIEYDARRTKKQHQRFSQEEHVRFLNQEIRLRKISLSD